MSGVWVLDLRKLRFPLQVLRRRLETFKERLRSRNIDAAMIRTQSTYTYFTGTRWLRPALLIPSNDEPVLFAARGEEEELASRTWIENVVTFRDGGDLMAKVLGIIRNSKYRVVGLEYGIERDAYVLFFEMFKLLNPGVKVVDISDIVYDMRTIKDEYELEAVRRAGEIAMKVMEKTLDVIKPSISETEIAGEAYYHAYRLGSEEPRIHVNVGPSPRVHSEPFRDVKVGESSAITIVLGIDYNHYYANMSRTLILDESDLARKALMCMNEVYAKALELTRPSVKPIEVMAKLDSVYRKYNMIDHRVVGYLHGVGLQIEEPPITTIIPKHRFIELKPGMVIAFVHAPILLKSVGQIKHEDTFIVNERSLEPTTVTKHTQ